MAGARSEVTGLYTRTGDANMTSGRMFFEVLGQVGWSCLYKYRRIRSQVGWKEGLEHFTHKHINKSESALECLVSLCFVVFI